MSTRFSRRDALKASGAALGGIVLGRPAEAGWDELSPPPGATQVNSLFKSLKPFTPGTPVEDGEMRISFLGTTPLQRRAQACSSLFVELGNPEKDCFVFDVGSGCTTNYATMNIPWSRLRRIFLTHLHGDHTSDLTHVYCFGPQGDAKRPLYIWGPSRSGIRNPWYGTERGEDQFHNPEFFEDGTLDFARHFREMNRWHTESQSFVQTQWVNAPADGYDIYATELDWRTGSSDARWSTSKELIRNPGFSSGQWVAYENNGVRVSFFPAVHDRNGSISYRLDWVAGGLSMIFTGDTRPSWFLVDSAKRGAKPVDVLVSEMVVDPEVWVNRISGMTDTTSADWALAMKNAEAVQENSHTPQKAFGYILRQLADAHMAPRLGVATHFQATNDTIETALNDVRSWYGGPVTIATDFVVLRVTQRSIEQCRAVISDYVWSARSAEWYAMRAPKYADLQQCNPYRPMAPLAQFDQKLLDNVIDPCLYDASSDFCTHAYPCADAGARATQRG